MGISRELLLAGFSKRFGHSNNVRLFFCPGRVCLIGEHLDYNGGFVLPAAISLGIYAVASKNELSKIRCFSEGYEGVVEIDLEQKIVRQEENTWANYIIGVIKQLNEEKDIQGMDIYLVSDLPDGAGLSSSAAVEVLTAFVVQTVSGIAFSLEEVALLCKDVENQFVGVKCGYMDQFAVALGMKNKALKLNCNSLDLELISANTGAYQFLIINTNKQRQLEESEFNVRKSQCEEALFTLKHDYKIETLAEATFEMVESKLTGKIKDRAIHVIQENNRVIKSGECLLKGDVARFGMLMNASHQSLKNYYEVSCDELDFIAENAIKLEGCIGARMTGAGFGGCCIALVKSEHKAKFKKDIEKMYCATFGFTPSVYAFSISDGVRELQD